MLKNNYALGSAHEKHGVRLNQCRTCVAYTTCPVASSSHVELNQNLPNLIDLDAVPASHLILALDSEHEKFAV
jgi:hypothetical protein